MSSGTFDPTRRAPDVAGVSTNSPGMHAGYRRGAVLVGAIVFGIWAASCAELFIRIGGTLHLLLAAPCTEQLNQW